MSHHQVVVKCFHLTQIASLLFAVAAACTLTTTPTITGNTSTAPAVTSATPPGVIELTYWHTLPGVAGQAQDELVARFNASQERIHVTSEFQGNFYTELAANLLTAYGAGSGPQVSQLGTYEILQFTKSGVLVDLKPYLNGADGIDTRDWPQTLLSAGEVNWPKGQKGLYWLPFNIAVPVLYYNRQAFEKAGLPEPPQTWDEFFEDARKLTVRDANGVVQRLGVAYWGISWPMLSAIWSEGGELTNKDYSNITLDDPIAVEVLTRFQDLVKEGAAVLPDEASGGQRGAFKNGRAAMILDSPSIFGEIFEQAVGFTPGVANYPAGKAGRVYAPGAGGLVMLSTTPPEKREAAWQFIKFMLSADSIAYYTRRAGYAAFFTAAQEKAADFLKDERYATIQRGLAYIRADFSINESAAVRNAFEEAWQKIFFQLADVKTTLDEADAKAEAEIKNEQ
jgi:sn-glycerol 3-phosphate transport system substrate-binding protein